MTGKTTTAPLRIGVLTPEFPFLPEDDSGIGHNYRILAESLGQLGHHAHVIVVTNRTDVPPDEKLEPVRGYTREVHRVRTPRFAAILLARRWAQERLVQRYLAIRRTNQILPRAVAEHRLQLIEASSFMALPLHYLQRRARVPVATRVATTDRQQLAQTPMHSRALRWMADAESRVIHRSDRLLTHTAAHRDIICQLEQLAPERFTLIPHGIPAPPPGLMPQHGDGRIRFLYVGGFNLRKGTDVLFAAIPRVLAACPNADFFVAGRHYDSPWWREFQARHGATFPGRVTCPGPVSRARLQELYAQCDVVVAPSRYESFGLVYIEGMSHGKTVVGCHCGGVPEVVRQGETGVLVEPGNADALAGQLIRLAGDTAGRERLGAAGRRDFERRFSAQRMAESSADFYRHVLAPREGFSDGISG